MEASLRMPLRHLLKFSISSFYEYLLPGEGKEKVVLAPNHLDAEIDSELQGLLNETRDFLER